MLICWFKGSLKAKTSPTIIPRRRTARATVHASKMSSDASSNIARPFSFLDLPGEIRNLIYEFVYETGNEVFVQAGHYSPKIKNSLVIAEACRQLRNEALPIFFRNNRFMLCCFWGYLPEFRHSLMRHEKSTVRREAEYCRRWLIQTARFQKYITRYQVSFPHADFHSRQDGAELQGEHVFCETAPCEHILARQVPPKRSERR